ncbi:MAG: FAD-dependent oxidoreductase [Terriglobia bacterium]
MTNRRAFLRSSIIGLGSGFLDISQSFGKSTAYDVVVYGATAAGVIAAVAAARQGANVALLEPGTHLGGMISGGLGHSDVGRAETIGGLSREFFERVGRHYGQPVVWDFEPHVAENVFRQMAREAGVKVYYRRRLNEHQGVVKRGKHIAAARMENGESFAARVFVDATYEGDLLGQAGVSFTVGREGRNQYSELFAGVRAVDQWALNRFDVPVPAYDSHGKLLPNVSAESPGVVGAADKKIPAYNFRLCLTNNPANRISIPEPSHYDPRDFALLAALIRVTTERQGRPPNFSDLTISTAKRSGLPHNKIDLNNQGGFSTDYIGKSWDYPTASYRRREEIWWEHFDYTAGFLYFLAHDPSVPEVLKSEVRPWGLARDEFLDTNHWPFQLYVREARRLVGDFVMTQRDAETEITKPDPIGMGSYALDSHNVQRYVQKDGTAQNEGDLEPPAIPYQIAYRVLLPQKPECTNLLVPVCCSASHVAYGTLRCEPVYMIMGHAAGIAAHMAAQQRCAVQDVSAAELTAELKRQRAIMEWSNPRHLTLHPVG